MVDPLYFLDNLILPMDGSDGLTTITDYSYRPAVMTANVGAALSTAVSEDGIASLALSGANGCCLSTPADPRYTLLIGDSFTIEAWVYISGDSLQGAGSLREAYLASCYGDTTQTLTGWELVILGSTTTTGTGLRVGVQSSGSGNFSSLNFTISKDTWHHIAVCKVGTAVSMFLDGVAQASVPTLPNSVSITNQTLRIGGTQSNDSQHRGLVGYVDSFRFTKNAARYTANFTPAAALDLDTAPIVNSLLPAFGKVQSHITPAQTWSNKSPLNLADSSGGAGTISGTVKEAGAPDTPAIRKVRLHRKSDGARMRETWSAADGTYSFNALAMQPYYVTAFDHTGNYNAVIKDSITPEPM